MDKGAITVGYLAARIREHVRIAREFAKWVAAELASTPTAL